MRKNWMDCLSVFMRTGKRSLGKIKKLCSKIEKQSSQAMATDMFISLVRKCARARKFPLRMLNELVEKIEVYHAEKQDGVWEKSRYPKFCPLPARK